jgi:hypothetical protein
VTEQPKVPENEEQAAEEPVGYAAETASARLPGNDAPQPSEPATVADTEIARAPAPADTEITPASAVTDPASVAEPAPAPGAESQAPEPIRPPPPPPPLPLPPLPPLPSDDAAGSAVRDRPEVTVAAAFAGGLLIALILRRLAR